MGRKLLAAIAGSSAIGIGIGLHPSQWAITLGPLSGISLTGFVVGCIQQNQIKKESINITVIRCGLAIALVTFSLVELLPPSDDSMRTTHHSSSHAPKSIRLQWMQNEVAIPARIYHPGKVFDLRRQASTVI